jgi:hypothetical protein
VALVSHDPTLPDMQRLVEAGALLVLGVRGRVSDDRP